MYRYYDGNQIMRIERSNRSGPTITLILYLDISYYVLIFPEPDENDIDLQGFYKQYASKLQRLKKQVYRMSKIY